MLIFSIAIKFLFSQPQFHIKYLYGEYFNNNPKLTHIAAKYL